MSRCFIGRVFVHGALATALTLVASCAHAQGEPETTRDLGVPSAVPGDSTVPTDGVECSCAQALDARQPMLAARLRRLTITRWVGLTLFVGGALMGASSVATQNPFAWGMTGVGLVSVSLMMLSPVGGLSRSLQVELGQLEAARWDTMRRVRRIGGSALVGVGMLALVVTGAATAGTRDPYALVLFGLPLGLPLAFAGSHLLLSSIDARPTARVRPQVRASVDPHGRGASVNVSATF